MTISTEREWEVTVSLTGVLSLPWEDDDTAAIVEQYLERSAGRGEIVDQFRKLHNQRDLGLRLNGYPVDVTIDDIELKETEVQSSDTDPRV